MGSSRLDSLLPESPLERLRWALLAIGGALALLPVLLLVEQGVGEPAAVLAMVLVVITVASWFAGARSGRLPVHTDVAAAGALLAVSVVMGPDEPAMAFGFAAMSIRAVYPWRLGPAIPGYPGAVAVGLGLGQGWALVLRPEVVVTLTAMAVVGVMYRLVVSGLEKYEATRLELHEAHRELEQRVDERTVDLAAANDALQDKVREVEATQTLVRRSAEYFRALIENGSDIVVVLRPDGRIRYLSPSVERALGYSAEEVLGRPFVEFLVDEDVASTLEVFNRALEVPDRRLPLAPRVLHREGAERQLEGIAHNLSENPAVGGVVFSARDTTERLAVERSLRKHEAELRQAQKMEAVGRLAGGVAHDFNNILTVIGGHAEYLRARLDDDAPLADEADEIRAAVDRAARLTRQLLVFSRREVAQPRILELDQVVNNVNKLIQRLLPESVELRLDLGSGALRVHADPGHLEQVILNLAVNSRDAMPDGGLLTITTTEVELTERLVTPLADLKPGSYAVLRVEDSGCGIPPEAIDRIFDPFFTTKGTGGTGLGLSTVFGIAKESGAGLRVESAVDVGTTFEVLFPARQGATTAPEPDMESIPAEGLGETLLLVEDEERLRVLAARGLRDRGYVVLSAANGEDAMRLSGLYHEPIDLLVTDVVMPGMTGPELHRSLEQERGRVPVLFMSGYPGQELTRHGIDPAALLPKPFTSERLAQTARRVLDEG